MSGKSVRRLIVLALLVRGAALEAEGGPPPAALVERVAPSIVSVKVVLKTEINMGESMHDQESVVDARGVVVDPKGLVMLWNAQLSSQRLMETVAQMGNGEDFDLKITPTDFRVALDGETNERHGFLAASDSDLDLAFVQIDPPLEKPLPAISFGAGRALAVGDRVVGVSRLSAGFDRAPFFETAAIAGELRKPRHAWILDASPALLGLPVFDERGDAAGVVVTVLSKATETASQGGDLMSFFALGRGRMENGPLGIFLLPAERVATLIGQARQRATELLVERAAAPEAAAGPH